MKINANETIEQYSYAYKKGRKQFIQDKLHKRNPYLLALDEIVDIYKFSSINIGVIEIPLELVIGTKTSGRKVSFASNFMPIVNKGSEFGFKWIRVCEHHLSDEGINDPPKVYEYLGKFYVEEGNKRVSVLKSYGAISLSCEVTRLIPNENDNSKEVKLYREFLKFYELSKLYSIQFRKLGYYTKLQKLMLFDETLVWNKQDRVRLIGLFDRFKELLKRKKLKVYYSDALLVMMEIYGYNNLYNMTDRELFRAINESKNKLIYDKAYNNILCISDEENDGLWNGYNNIQLKQYDFIISAGDLKAEYLEYLVTVSNKQLFYVHGNHDEKYDIKPPEGCVCIDDDVYVHDGIRILGLGGSYKYKDDAKHMYTERQMRWRIIKLRRKINKVGGIDIVVTHAPIKGYGDLDDYAHQGFECFKWLIKEYHPKYFLFGHIHPRYNTNYKTFYELDGTQIINVCDKQRIVY